MAVSEDLGSGFGRLSVPLCRYRLGHTGQDEVEKALRLDVLDEEAAAAKEATGEVGPAPEESRRSRRARENENKIKPQKEN